MSEPHDCLPVETAPKENGARFLGWCKFPAGEEWRIVTRFGRELSAHGMVQAVTHWAPLPKSPRLPLPGSVDPELATGSEPNPTQQTGDQK